MINEEFAQKADEIAKDIYIHHFDDDINYPCVLKAIAVGVQKGAEHAYNKANEWHFVKDGDLPKDSCVVYYKDSLGVPSWAVVHPSWYIAGIEAFFKNNPQIIAWKEIVLPELKESE